MDDAYLRVFVDALSTGGAVAQRGRQSLWTGR